MTYEPRSRGIRSRRSSPKKASREKKDKNEESYFYEEPVPVDPGQLSGRVTNALQHLGNQRFPLPPFSEHFKRWRNDVDEVLAEFTTALPQAIDEEYKAAVTKLLEDIRVEFDKRIDTEKNVASELSTVQQQLSTCELELSKLEQEQRKKREDVKRGHEKSKKKILNEIDALDRHRLRLLKQKPTFLEKLLGKSKSGLEESANKIQARKTSLAGNEKGLQHQLDDLKSDYEEKRKSLLEQEKSLKEKLTGLRSSNTDDALEMRNNACQGLSQAVLSSVDRVSAHPKEEPDSAPQTPS